MPPVTSKTLTLLNKAPSNGQCLVSGMDSEHMPLAWNFDRRVKSAASLHAAGVFFNLLHERNSESILRSDLKLGT